jgi:uncharacterized protein YegJ (DUF2314 family)
MKKAWFIYMFFVAVACQNSDDESTNESGLVTGKNAEGEEAFTFSSGDAKMNAAIAQANKTWPLFEQNIFTGEPGTSHFAAKMIFRFLGDEEHLWLINLHKKNGFLYGILDDPPFKIKDMKVGDTIMIKKDRISDWVYAENGKMIGGYTIRVIYNNMSPQEKQKYAASLPYKIE